MPSHAGLVVLQVVHVYHEAHDDGTWRFGWNRETTICRTIVTVTRKTMTEYIWLSTSATVIAVLLSFSHIQVCYIFFSESRYPQQGSDLRDKVILRSRKYGIFVPPCLRMKLHWPNIVVPQCAKPQHQNSVASFSNDASVSLKTSEPPLELSAKPERCNNEILSSYWAQRGDSWNHTHPLPKTT